MMAVLTSFFIDFDREAEVKDRSIKVKDRTHKVTDRKELSLSFYLLNVGISFYEKIFF